MGMLDKVKGLVKGNRTEVNKGLDKASDLLTKKVGDKHADKVDMGVDKVKDALKKLD